MAPQDSVSDLKSTISGDVQEQISILRGQLDTLMRERVKPMVADAAGIAQTAATRARDIAEDQLDSVSDTVSGNPLTSILIAAAAGFLIGRFSR